MIFLIFNYFDCFINYNVFDLELYFIFIRNGFDNIYRVFVVFFLRIMLCLYGFIVN